MSGEGVKRNNCPHCGCVIACNDDTGPDFFHPWHVRGRRSVKEYVATLGEEAHEWLLALFVNKNMQLLAVDTIGRGDVSTIKVNSRRIFELGWKVGAEAFVLVHNHPSGDAMPSLDDIRFTVWLAGTARHFGTPLLDHLIVAGDQMRSVMLHCRGGTEPPPPGTLTPQLFQWWR